MVCLNEHSIGLRSLDMNTEKDADNMLEDDIKGCRRATGREVPNIKLRINTIVEPTHELTEILCKKLMGIEIVPVKEQTKMVHRAVKAAEVWARKLEAENKELKSRCTECEEGYNGQLDSVDAKNKQLQAENKRIKEGIEMVRMHLKGYLE